MRRAGAGGFLVLMGLFLLGGCDGPPQEADGGSALKVAEDIVERRAQFVEQTLSADVTHLSDGDRKALKHLVAAARIMDEIFLVQAWTGNPEFAAQVAGLEGDGAAAARDYYRIMYGPWDRLQHLEPFLGEAPHPPGAGYYPDDVTVEEFNSWIEAHPDDRESFTGLFTVIRRSGDDLVAIPYSQEYRPQLERAAAELRAAAAATDNESLKRFLELRAEAFFSDDYYASDLAWMDLDSPIEVVIGPYETYEDGLFGYKAAFEAFICVAQPADVEQLERIKKELPFLEQNLPIPDEHKNPNRGSESPIRVVDELFTAGDTKAGVQTLAFNLPNDERVREEKGSKKVMLKNMMHAKYSAVLEPIAERVLEEGAAEKIDFDAYFSFILFHELAHSLGPGIIEIDGRRTEVRHELRDLYSAIEEAKADVVGVYCLLALADRGVVDAALVDHLPWTYTAGLFRSARFGVREAHGLGVVIQASFLLEQGAIEITPEGRFRPVPDRFPEAFRALAHELLMAQALGSYSAAEQLIEQYGTPPAEMMQAIAGLEDIPVDVDPVFPLTGLQ